MNTIYLLRQAFIILMLLITPNIVIGEAIGTNTPPKHRYNLSVAVFKEILERFPPGTKRSDMMAYLARNKKTYRSQNAEEYTWYIISDQYESDYTHNRYHYGRGIKYLYFKHRAVYPSIKIIEDAAEYNYRVDINEVMGIFLCIYFRDSDDTYQGFYCSSIS